MSVDTARILLIEDDPAHAELINRAFEEEATDYELTTLTNLTQARQFLAEHTPHLVITDYVLPDGRGDEILEWAHGAFPVIVMTAQGSEQAAVELMKAGVLDYVVKSPAAFSGMRHTAKRALREWQHVIERQRAEEALRQNEERFRQIIFSISDHIYVTRITQNGEMINLYLSPHIEALTGYPIGKMMADWNFWQSTLIHLNDKIITANKSERLKRGEACELEYRIVRADGELLWVRDSARVQNLDSGESIIYGVISDITERKRSEEALYLDQVRREVLLQLNQMTEASIGEIMSTALEDFTRITESPIGYMAFVNPDETVMTMHAWSESALEECRVLEKPIEYPLETAGLWGEAVRQRRPIITNDYQAPNPSKRGYPEGHVEVIRHMNIPVFEGNHIVMVVGVGNKPTCYTETDVQQLQLLSAGLWQIIQRKRAEQEREELLVQLKEQANQVQQLMNTVPEGVLLLDSRKCITLANPLGEEYLLTLANSRVGDTLTHLGDHPLVDFLTSPPQGLWHTAVVNTCHFEVISRPLESSTLNQHWVLVIRDVTQQREIEHRAQQQERLAAVGQLAAGIAHDFNNILAVITLYAKMSLRAPDLPAKLQERLEIIDQQAWRASSLVQQILDFSRRAVLERSPLDLRAFLEEQVKLLERTLPEHIGLNFFCDPETYIVNADPTRLQQAFMNLATNARDAMPNGGELHISLKHLHLDEHAHPTSQNLPPELTPGDWIQITLTDTGGGIPENILPHLFEPFYTTKAPGQGTGLGLSQVYGIIRQHEGYIDVHTEPDKGTTFYLYLPALIAPASESPPLPMEHLLAGQGQVILIVEDNPATRQALVQSLQLLNYRTREAANGREALQILSQQEPTQAAADQVALVLSDVVMPEMGGLALFQTLKERGLRMKVILLTGHPMGKELESLEAQGLSGWLLKPPDIDGLAQAIARALKKP